MPINTPEIISVVTQVTEDCNVRVTITESFKGGCIAATATIAGGLILGPVGMAIGGAVGGCAAAAMSKSFKPIPQVIMQDMTHAQRERLAQSVAAVIADLRAEDAIVLLPLILNNPGTKEAVLRTVFSFIQNEMRLQIVD